MTQQMIKKTSPHKLKLNPDNPRTIKDANFQKLVNSIKEFPEMLEIRPIVVNKDMVVLGGNMRLRACKEAGLKEVPYMIADELTEEKQREFIIKDNVSGGEWDWEILANEWDAGELNDWGLDVPYWNANEPDQQKKDVSEYDFENYDNSGFTTIRIVLDDDRARELIQRIDTIKENKNLSEFIYEHFCN